jgi:hypothetical protein
MSSGTSQDTFAVVVAYHPFGSGCVDDLITGAAGVFGGATYSGCGFTVAALMVYEPPYIFVSTFVPRPSAASTDPSVKVKSVEPEPSARKVTEITVPVVPEYPFGEPPPKEMTPELFEKVGSWVQRLKMELARDTVTTESSRESNESLPSAAFIDLPAVLTRTRTVKFPPDVYTPVGGVTLSVAANARGAYKKKILTENKSILRVIHLFRCIKLLFIIFRK